MKLKLGLAFAAAALLGGCQASQKNNSSAANSAGSNSGAVNSTASNSGDSLATVNRSDPAAVRSALISHCEQRLRNNPQTPASLDARAACTCAFENSMANQQDVPTYIESMEGAQAFGTALRTCGVQQVGAAGAQQPAATEEAAPDAPEAAEAEAEGEEK
jgi:hypothetical protein